MDELFFDKTNGRKQFLVYVNRFCKGCPKLSQKNINVWGMNEKGLVIYVRTTQERYREIRLPFKKIQKILNKPNVLEYLSDQ